MAIRGADATPPVSRETRVAAARAQRAEARAATPPTRPAAGSQVAPVGPARLRLPEITPHEIAFRHDPELNRVIVEVVDPETGAVVRTIPPEEIVQLFKIIRRAQGNLLDEEA